MVAILILIAILAVRADAAPLPQTAPVESSAGDNDGDLDDLVEDRPIGQVPPEAGPGPLTSAPIAAPPVAVAAVVAAARRAGGVAGDPTGSWRTRARLAALAPTVSVTAGRDDLWHDVADPTLEHVNVFQLRAAWRFDRLVFEPNELRIAAVDVSRRRERRRLGLVAARTYFTWLRLRSATVRDPRWAAAAEEAAAELDAMTDGWFSQALAKSAESPGPPPKLASGHDSPPQFH